MQRGRVHNWLQTAQGWLLPPRCVRCAAAGRPPTIDLCGYCEDELVANRNACRRCALPLPAVAGAPCVACQRRTRRFDTAFAAYRYEYPVDRLVQRFKYQGELAVGRVLGELIARSLAARTTELPQALVPVPLARAKQRERGFNQALELARPIGRALMLPIRMDLCARVRVTQDQAGLAAGDRRRNVRGAFTATRANMPRHLALIDDVLTTGSTCDELARVLKGAGAERVDVWALARAGEQRGQTPELRNW
jgi:ComF family protein